MRKLLSALAFGGAAAALALVSPPAHATLHGFCGGGATSLCVDNGTNSPFNLNPPNPFGFTSSPPGEIGTLFLKVLVLDNETVAGPFAVTGAATATARPATDKLTNRQLNVAPLCRLFFCVARRQRSRKISRGNGFSGWRRGPTARRARRCR